MPCLYGYSFIDAVIKDYTKFEPLNFGSSLREETYNAFKNGTYLAISHRVKQYTLLKFVSTYWGSEFGIFCFHKFACIEIFFIWINSEW